MAGPGSFSPVSSMSRFPIQGRSSTSDLAVAPWPT
jgi:hypothetical protein